MSNPFLVFQEEHALLFVISTLAEQTGRKTSVCRTHHVNRPELQAVRVFAFYPCDVGGAEWMPHPEMCRLKGTCCLWMWIPIDLYQSDSAGSRLRCAAAQFRLHRLQRPQVESRISHPGFVVAGYVVHCIPVHGRPVQLAWRSCGCQARSEPPG